MSETLRQDVENLARAAKGAARVVANAPTERKNAVLRRAAATLRGAAAGAILEANAADVAAAQAAGLAPALIDRLRVDRPRLEGIAAAVEAVAALPDPVGQLSGKKTLANGLEIARMRIPLGLVAIIYESRPNVTADAAALCLKSGNACVLRGGSEAFQSSRAIAGAFHDALRSEGLPPEAVTLLPTTSHEAIRALVALDGVVDLAIPRGGEKLIRFVAEHARVPVVRHYKGVCHVYVDGEADLDVAERIAVNAKVQRPGVCNAMETLLVDRAVAPSFLPRVCAALRAQGVEVRGDDSVRAVVADVSPARAEDWDAEYLDLILAVGVVDGIEGALAHVARHGTNHTEAIVTRNRGRADRWVREVDASLVLVNASTRFNDGGELGLGAEIGISTTKMHAYGPMGLEELCALKWIGYGHGQIRG